jgi:hypothetical protein
VRGARRKRAAHTTGYSPAARGEDAQGEAQRRVPADATAGLPEREVRGVLAADVDAVDGVCDTLACASTLYSSRPDGEVRACQLPLAAAATVDRPRVVIINGIVQSSQRQRERGTNPPGVTRAPKSWPHLPCPPDPATSSPSTPRPVISTNSRHCPVFATTGTFNACNKCCQCLFSIAKGCTFFPMGVSLRR